MKKAKVTRTVEKALRSIRRRNPAEAAELAERVQKVPVTTRALVQRISRKLAAEADPRRLKAAKGKAREKLGDYYVLDCIGGVELVDVNPEKLGRELGVLQPWETVV